MYKYGIVSIGYKNASGMRRLLNALNNAKYDRNDITLIISIDHSDDNSVLDMANDFKWGFGKKIVNSFSERLGLRNHVIRCGNYMNEYALDAIVVFEDDMMPSEDFFCFTEACTEKYIHNDDVAGISLYTHCINFQTENAFVPLKASDADVYFFQCAQSRGQVWFRKQWNDFIDWYEINKNRQLQSERVPRIVTDWPTTSWLKYHITYCIEKEKYFVYPYISFSTCFGDVGQHVKNRTNMFQVPLSKGNFSKFSLPELGENTVAYDAFFENKRIYKELGLSQDELLVDLYGHHVATKKRFILSKRKFDYPVIRTWGDKLIPHELNITYEIEGNEIFLYDIGETGIRVDLEELLCMNDTGKQLFLYGAGIEGKKWLKAVGEKYVAGFIDSDESKAGQYIYRKRIYSLKEIREMGDDVYIFISANYKNSAAIKQKIEEHGLYSNIVGTPYVNKSLKVSIDAMVDSMTVFEGKNYVGKDSVIKRCEFGYGSYVAVETKLSDVRIGRYSCIGPNVNMVIGQHPTDTFVSVSPYFYSIKNSVGSSYISKQLFEENVFTKDNYRVEIGNDVWIGANVTIMEGVTISDGTIVAAGANVVKDTEPFSVIGGNPAKIIKYRFNREQIDFLLKFKWWDMPKEWIEENAEVFCNIDKFMNLFG